MNLRINHSRLSTASSPQRFGECVGYQNPPHPAHPRHPLPHALVPSAYSKYFSAICFSSLLPSLRASSMPPPCRAVECRGPLAIRAGDKIPKLMDIDSSHRVQAGERRACFPQLGAKRPGNEKHKRKISPATIARFTALKAAPIRNGWCRTRSGRTDNRPSSFRTPWQPRRTGRLSRCAARPR